MFAFVRLLCHVFGYFSLYFLHAEMRAFPFGVCFFFSSFQHVNEHWTVNTQCLPGASYYSKYQV